MITLLTIAFLELHSNRTVHMKQIFKDEKLIEISFFFASEICIIISHSNPMLSHFAGQLLRRQKPSEAISCVYSSFTAECNNCTFN